MFKVLKVKCAAIAAWTQITGLVCREAFIDFILASQRNYMGNWLQTINSIAIVLRLVLT